MYVSNTPSLLDYIGDPEKAKNTLSELASRPKGTEMASDIRSLTALQSDEGIEQTIEKIAAGDTSVSLNRVGNLLEHIKAKVFTDLQDVAGRLDISGEISFSRENGNWTVSQEGQTESSAAIDRLQQYLDKASDLNNKLSQINQLSEMVELGQAREYASTLKSQGAEDSQIVTYLTDTRARIFAEDKLMLSQQDVVAKSEGVSTRFYNAISGE
ncbi:hypothetical protein [Alteromonas sp. H39]|uniref:hypothetical protein n=1 Tax=Alteromonas sp. H39 TaxID=3389876 RepID=UPI0039DFC366